MPEIDKVSEHQDVFHIENEGAYRHIILGSLFGIGLRQRGPRDLHVSFDILTDDDGSWYIREIRTSTGWFSDLMSVIERADKWCHANCLPDMYPANPNVKNSPLRQYGWKFHG